MGHTAVEISVNLSAHLNERCVCLNRNYDISTLDNRETGFSEYNIP